MKLSRPRAARRALLAAALSALTLVLPAAAPAAGLHLSVTPKRADVGQRTCFTFEATRGGAPVRGAAVSFEAGAPLRTDAAGSVRRCAKLAYPGAHGALVEAGGASARTKVSAVALPGAGPAAKEWHQTHPFIQGPDCAGEFGKASTRDSRCIAGYLSNPCCDPSPLPGYGFLFKWSGPYSGSSRIEITFDYGAGYFLRGEIPDRGSDRFTVTDGFFRLNGTGPFIGEVVSGSDPTKRPGEKGGPLSFNAVFRRDWTGGDGRTHYNYDFDIQGWLYY
jgi:hypothetical protein